MATHKWIHPIPLARTDEDEMIQQGDEFDARDMELRAFPDRIEELDGEDGNDDAQTPAESPEEGPADVGEIDGVGPELANSLVDAGFELVSDVQEATVDQLTEADSVGQNVAQNIKDEVSTDE